MKISNEFVLLLVLVALHKFVLLYIFSIAYGDIVIKLTRSRANISAYDAVDGSSPRGIVGRGGCLGS